MTQNTGSLTMQARENVREAGIFAHRLRCRMNKLPQTSRRRKNTSIDKRDGRFDEWYSHSVRYIPFPRCSNLARLVAVVLFGSRQVDLRPEIHLSEVMKRIGAIPNAGSSEQDT